MSGLTPCDAATLQPQVYWAQFVPTSIMRANVDGSNVSQVIGEGAHDMIIDKRRNAIYWSGYDVARSTLDGEARTSLFDLDGY